jgi:hypothetical protein
MAANDMSFSGHAIPDLHVNNVIPDGFDDTREFMTEYVRRNNILLRPCIPTVNM